MEPTTKPPVVAGPDAPKVATLHRTPLLDRIGESRTVVGNAGRYTNLELIHDTPNSYIYKATREGDGKTVAVKEIKPSALKFYELAEREAVVGKQLDHPNLVKYFDQFDLEGTSFVVSEFIEGKNLRQLKEAGRIYTREEFLGMMSQIIDALEYLHTTFAQPVIHRDLKPDNIILEEGTGRVVVVDLGHVSTRDSTGTTALAINSTGFTAPEIALAWTDITPNADLYSFGAVYSYLLTGRDANAVIAGGIPTSLETKHRLIIEGCVQMEPADRRFGSAKQIKDELNGVVTVPVELEKPVEKKALVRVNPAIGEKNKELERLKAKEYSVEEAEFREDAIKGLVRLGVLGIIGGIGSSFLGLQVGLSIVGGFCLVYNLIRGSSDYDNVGKDLGAMGAAIVFPFSLGAGLINQLRIKRAEQELKELSTGEKALVKVSESHGKIWRVWRMLSRFVPFRTNYWQMFRAAERGDIETVRWCLEMGLNPNETTQYGVFKKHGETLLETAFKNNHLDVAQVAVNYGADVNRTPHVDKYDPLERFICEPEKVEFLLRNGANPNARLRASDDKIGKSNNGPRYLLGNRIIHGYGLCGDTTQTVLMHACRLAPLESVRLLLENGADLNARDGQGQTALMYAIQSDIEDFQKIKFLIDMGANLGLRDADKNTAIMVALRHIKIGVFEFLLGKGTTISKEEFSHVMNSYNVHPSEVTERMHVLAFGK